MLARSLSVLLTLSSFSTSVWAADSKRARAFIQDYFQASIIEAKNELLKINDWETFTNRAEDVFDGSKYLEDTQKSIQQSRGKKFTSMDVQETATGLIVAHSGLMANINLYDSTVGLKGQKFSLGNFKVNTLFETGIGKSQSKLPASTLMAAAAVVTGVDLVARHHRSVTCQDRVRGFGGYIDQEQYKCKKKFGEKNKDWSKWTRLTKKADEAQAVQECSDDLEKAREFSGLEGKTCVAKDNKKNICRSLIITNACQQYLAAKK